MTLAKILKQITIVSLSNIILSSCSSPHSVETGCENELSGKPEGVYSVDLAVMPTRIYGLDQSIVFSLRCEFVFKKSLISDETVHFLNSHPELSFGEHISGRNVYFGNFLVYVFESSSGAGFFILRFNDPIDTKLPPNWIQIRRKAGDVKLKRNTAEQ